MKFEAVFPYQQSVLTLPVKNLDEASEWYGRHFGLTEVERRDTPPSVIMERDGVQMGFAITGADPEQDGAAVLVSDIEGVAADFTARGLTVANRRMDQRDGKDFHVFFVVAPDGLCYYFHEPA